MLKAAKTNHITMAIQVEVGQRHYAFHSWEGYRQHNNLITSFHWIRQNSLTEPLLMS